MRIAIQKKGRLTHPTIEFLNSLGICLPNKFDGLYYKADNEFELVFLKYADIQPAVLNGFVDIGIIGTDTLIEERSLLVNRIILPFGQCDLVLALKKSSLIQEIKDLRNKKIATPFPSITSNYLQKNNVNANILPVHGSTEIYSYLDYVDGIVDLVETGKTLAIYKLIILERIMHVSATLIFKKDIDSIFLEKVNNFIKNYDNR